MLFNLFFFVICSNSLLGQDVYNNYQTEQNVNQQKQQQIIPQQMEENGVVEEPTVKCGIDSLSLEIHTINPFSGRLFVNGFSQEKHCQSLGNGSSQRLQFTVQFGQCGLRRTRELNGVSVQTIVVVSFHPIFVTKLDRAYRLNCFYTEAHKTFTQRLEVVQLTTSGNIFRKSDAMPQCRYDILWQNANGQSIRFARIGDIVFHRWSCQTPEIGTYCMRVHSCSVSDGQGGEPVEVIDRKGCGVDALLLRDLEYTDDLTAGQSAFVFKFADKPALHFNCQIELTLREEWSTNGCEPNRPKCLPASTYQYTQQFQQQIETTTKLYYDIDNNEAIKEENKIKNQKNNLTTKTQQIIKEKELPPAHYRINEDWTRRIATTIATILNKETIKFPPQTEVIPSNYATEFATTEENKETTEIDLIQQQDSIYQDEVNSSVKRGTPPPNKEEIDRRLPRKVADFDLPEQSLLVIELDEHSLVNQPMILRLLNNSLINSKQICHTKNSFLFNNVPFGSILLILFCLLILLLAFIWNILTKKIKNNNNKNNCILIGHKKRINKFENYFLWKKRKNNFNLPKFEEEKHQNDDEQQKYFSSSSTILHYLNRQNNINKINNNNCGGLRF